MIRVYGVFQVVFSQRKTTETRCIIEYTAIHEESRPDGTISKERRKLLEIVNLEPNTPLPTPKPNGSAWLCICDEKTAWSKDGDQWINDGVKYYIKKMLPYNHEYSHKEAIQCALYDQWDGKDYFDFSETLTAGDYFEILDALGYGHYGVLGCNLPK